MKPRIVESAFRAHSHPIRVSNAGALPGGGILDIPGFAAAFAQLAISLCKNSQEFNDRDSESKMVEAVFLCAGLADDAMLRTRLLLGATGFGQRKKETPPFKFSLGAFHESISLVVCSVLLDLLLVLLLSAVVRRFRSLSAAAAAPVSE